MTEIKEKIQEKETDLNILNMLTGGNAESFIDEFKKETPNNDKQDLEKQNLEKQDLEKKESEKTETTQKIELPDNPYLKGLQIEEPKVETPIEIKSIDEAYSLIKSETGFEIKEPAQLKEFAVKHKELQESNSKLLKVQDEFNKQTEIITNLPDEIQGLISLAIQNGAWEEEGRKIFSQPNIPFDHKLDFAKQDAKSMIEYFFPKEFTNDDFEDMETTSMKFAIKKAKEAYESLQTKLNTPRKTNYREQTQKQIDEYNQKFTSSIENSVKSLTEQSKFFTPQQIEEVKKEMLNGFDSIHSEYFEKDGTWKADAAEKRLFNKYGKQALEALKSFVSNRAKTEANEDILKRELLGKSKKEPDKEFMETLSFITGQKERKKNIF